jgi:hypothetical protein
MVDMEVMVSVSDMPDMVVSDTAVMVTAALMEVMVLD